MNDDRAVMEDTPVEPVWDLSDEEMDRPTPARGCACGWASMVFLSAK